MSDRIRTAPDVSFRPAGVGMAATFMCLGCGGLRLIRGSKGNGVRRRCAGCVAERAWRVAA